ncbi:NAD-dependent epimerase/dehydratase family protein [Micromonospora sp. MS34]|uniref:NAD-dependent epimerase/dehydratase family protein n=1 Tax=Micromonospora sp. MS34 TaxID=3385971 RepID=UPI0039A038C3
MIEACVIGGSRYFGRLLIAKLLASEVRVTVLNRGSTPAPPEVTHLRADRDDEDSLRAALGSRTFDVVVDQVCYTPRQAAVARRVFAGRIRRYVMTSTIEVYDPAGSAAVPPASPGTPVSESTIDLSSWSIRPDLPWHDPDFLDANYGEGKRQAEAEFSRETGFTFASVRSGHVLGGGANDFTGRLDHYIQRVRSGRPVAVHRTNHRSSFISRDEIADVLCWAAQADFAGAVNARSHVELSVTDICQAIAAAGLGHPVFAAVEPGAEASPYAFDRYYGMDNARAERLGFRFSCTTDWLPRVVAEAVADGRGPRDA